MWQVSWQKKVCISGVVVSVFTIVPCVHISAIKACPVTVNWTYHVSKKRIQRMLNLRTFHLEQIEQSCWQQQSCWNDPSLVPVAVDMNITGSCLWLDWQNVFTRVPVCRFTKANKMCVLHFSFLFGAFTVNEEWLLVLCLSVCLFICMELGSHWKYFCEILYLVWGVTKTCQKIQVWL
jgi:hypothetical protein